MLVHRITILPKNEVVSKTFIDKLIIFANNKIDFRVKWITKKIRSLFKLKDKNPYPACLIYQGTCSCDKVYIGQTRRNAIIRWNEHQNVKKSPEPVRHLKEFAKLVFNWEILCQAPDNFRARLNLEALIIALKRPQLNEQLDSNKLNLFRNGIT